MIVFRGGRKPVEVLQKSAAPVVDVPAVRATVQDKRGGITQVGLQELAVYARSVLDGHPDQELERIYKDTSLAGQFAAMRANPKIAQVFA